MSVLVLMQARKVTFYRNGDRFFTGLVYPIKPQLRKMEQYRAFEQLLAEVQKSPPRCLFYSATHAPSRRTRPPLSGLRHQNFLDPWLFFYNWHTVQHILLTAVNTVRQDDAHIASARPRERSELQPSCRSCGYDTLQGVFAANLYFSPTNSS